MLAHSLNLTINVFLRNRCLRLFNLESLIFAKRNLGALGKLRRKHDIPALFKRYNVDFRARHRLHILLLQCLIKRLLGNSLKCLLKDGFLPDKILDDLAGGLSLTESRNIHTSCDTLGRTVRCILQLFLLHFNRQRDLAVLTMLRRNLHCMKQPPAFSFESALHPPICGHAKRASSAIVLVSYHKTPKMTSTAISAAPSYAGVGRRDPCVLKESLHLSLRSEYAPSLPPGNP